MISLNDSLSLYTVAISVAPLSKNDIACAQAALNEIGLDIEAKNLFHFSVPL